MSGGGELCRASVELLINGPVAELRLQRQPVNALDEAALRDITEAAKQAEDDPAVRVVIITSALKGVFCVGGDLKFWPRAYGSQPKLVSEAGRTTFTQIEQLTKPSIAAIQGHVIGDGLSLALACDVRLASQDSEFHLPEVGYGFIPGWGTIGRLVRAVGSGPAAELLLVGDAITAVRAENIGLVNRVVGPDELTPEVKILAARLAAKPPMALRYAKAALTGGSGPRSSDQESLGGPLLRGGLG